MNLRGDKFIVFKSEYKYEQYKMFGACVDIICSCMSEFVFFNNCCSCSYIVRVNIIMNATHFVSHCRYERRRFVGSIYETKLLIIRLQIVLGAICRSM